MKRQSQSPESLRAGLLETVAPSTPVIVGIDPGLGGAIAVIDGGEVEVMPMPTLKSPKGKGHVLDTVGIAKFFKDLIVRTGRTPTVILERQQAMRKQGVSSTFRTGEGYGLLRGICVGMGIPLEVVQARTWQKAMFNGRSHDESKAASIQRAGELFPHVSLRPSPRCSKPSHGLSDALLIAEYGRRLLLGGSITPEPPAPARNDARAAAVERRCDPEREHGPARAEYQNV